MDVAHAIVQGSSSILSPRKGDSARNQRYVDQCEKGRTISLSQYSESVDHGEEIRFSVELTRLRNLPGLLSVDVKRLRGDVWAYKLVHDTLIE